MSEHCMNTNEQNKQGDHSNHNQDSSHDKHTGHSVGMFRDKFWFSLALTIPVLIYSEMIQMWFRFTPLSFIGSEYVPFIFSTILFGYGGLVFIKSAKAEILAKRPGMMTLISLAIITAYIYSVGTLFWLKGESFFWELALLITIMLLGHWLEMASVARAENALDSIAKLLPDMAEKIVNGKPEMVHINELKVGDKVLVRPGGYMPVDGVILEGSSLVDESAITGESRPISKSKNDEVNAGTINQNGSLTIKVSKLGEDTTIAGIMRLVQEAQKSKSNTQVLADKAAFVLTIVAIATSVATFIYWFLTKDAGFALERSVTVLIIACPHALGLAIPLVVAISTAKSARNGILVRKRIALESARNLNWVLFDKTGTLTKGEHTVTDIWATKGYKENDILQISACLEQGSEHFIGKGIVNYANKKHLQISKVTNFEALAGLGVKAKLGNVNYIVASGRYVKEKNISIPLDLSTNTLQVSKNGKTVVYLIKGNKQVIGAIAVADELRSQSKVAVEHLKSIGIKTAMVTGDSEGVANYVAKNLGIRKVFAEVKPAKKSEIVKQLQKDGNRVAFVGDGINDAPALTQANIGLAIGAGTDVAIKSADIILVKDNPSDVVKVINLSSATYRKMVQNLIWATGYNVLAIPLATGVLFNKGIILTPAVGAILMTLSTIIVAFNAQLLRKIKI